MDSRTSPRRSSLSPCCVLTAGMWATQLASTAPFTKKIAETASRALAGEPIMALDAHGLSSSAGPA